MNRADILVGGQVLLAGLLLAGTTFESTYDMLIAFWPLLIAFVCCSYYFTLRAETRRTREVILLVFIATVSLSSILLLPGAYRMDKDAYFEFQYASTIIKNGYINVSEGLGYAKDYYGNNPPLHLLLSELSLLTGVPAIVITKYLMLVLLRTLAALIAFLIFKEVCRRFRLKDVYAYLGAIVFCASYGTLSLGISRRSIAIIYLLLLIHISVRNMRRTKKAFLVLLFSALVVVSDHSVAYMLIFSSFGIFALCTILLIRKRRRPDAVSIAFLGLAVFCLAVFIVSRGDAFYLYANEYNYVREFAEKFLTQDAASHTAQNIDTTQYLIKSIITLSSQILFFILALPGFLALYRKIKALPDSEKAEGTVFLAVLSLSFAAFPVMLFLLKTTAAVYTQPFMWLPYMLLSLCFVYSLEGIVGKKLRNQLLILGIVSFVVMGNFLLSYPTSVLASKDPSRISLEDYSAKTDELYYSGEWLRENEGQRYVLVDGDPTVFDIYGPFFGIEVTGEWWINSLYSANDTEYDRLLLENRTIYTKMRGNYPQRADYIVTNRLVYRYSSSYLGDNKKFYGLDRFDNSTALDCLYDNWQIQIRRIDYGQATG